MSTKKYKRVKGKMYVCCVRKVAAFTETRTELLIYVVCIFFNKNIMREHLYNK